MIRKLPYADWMTAQADLRAVSAELLKIDFPGLAPMLEQIRRSLVAEASPTLAGAELESLADQLRPYPELRESVSDLSKRLIDFPFAEPAPDVLAIAQAKT